MGTLLNGQTFLKSKNGCHGNNCVNDWSDFHLMKNHILTTKIIAHSMNHIGEPVSSTSFVYVIK